LNFETKREFGGEISLEYQEEGVQEDFLLSDSIRIGAGNYSFVSAGVEFRTPQSKMVSVFMELNGGEFYDGQRFGIMAVPP